MSTAEGASSARKIMQVSWTVRIAYPPEIARYLVFKGSVTVEGMSLTIAALADEYFEIAVIPKTWQATNLSASAPRRSCES
ncbi:MAG: hypothetical protein WKF84_02480 [Pyrinomonadaceae bacterium]